MIIKTINGIEYLCIPLDDIRNLKVKPEVMDIPTIQEFIAYARENKPLADFNELSIKYKAWKENRWCDGNGKKIKNWKSKLLNTLPYIKESATQGRREQTILREDYGIRNPKAVEMPESLKKKIHNNCM